MSETGAAPARRISRRRILISLVLALAALVALAALFITTAIRSAPIPLGTPSGEIAFVANRAGQWDLFLLSPDGTLTNLTTVGAGATANDYFPSWSLDSQRINFLSDRTGITGPTQIEPDGSNPASLDIVSAIFTVFSQGRLDWDPAWSPGARQMAWSSLRDLNLELYVIDTAAEFTAENAARLTNAGARDWFAAWSPDGTKLAFASDRASAEVDNIYVLDLASGAISALTADTVTAIYPMWSLDGSQIAYISEREHPLESGIVDFYIMNADGSDQRPLEGIFEGDPTWSPDGSQMAYVSNRDGRWHIYLRDANGDNVRRLTAGDYDHFFPVWRP